MIAAIHQHPDGQLVNPQQARTVVGILAMLVRMVGAQSCIGLVLQQARSEIISLMESEQRGSRTGPREVA